MILIEPIKKLNLLKGYMNRRINKMPDGYISFERYIRIFHPDLIKGKPEYHRKNSTNCFYCRKESNKLTIDHFYPQSKTGGGDLCGIYVICCHECNVRKGNMHPMEWIRSLNLISMGGSGYKDFTPKRTAKMADQVNKIMNDIVFGRVKRVYYIDNKAHKRI